MDCSVALLRPTLLVLLLLVAGLASAALHSGIEATKVGEARCPPRPRIPSAASKYRYFLPGSLLDAIGTCINTTTLAPCKAFASSPSTATAISVSVVFGDKTYYLNYGCKNVSAAMHEPPTEDTIFRLASVSKTFTLQTMVDAFLDGRIRSLDDTVQTYVPNFVVRNTFPTNEKRTRASGQPTWRQMGSQLSGLPRDSPCDPTNCNMTTDDALQRIKEYIRLLTPAYNRASYSNLAYSLIGHLVSEKLYNATFTDHLKATVTAPLGMNSTGCDLTPDVLQRMAVEYTKFGVPVPPIHMQWDNPAGGVHTTARDMATWVRHFLSNWQVDDMYKEWLLPMFIEGSGKSGWGMPWEWALSDGTGYVIRTKGGYIPGVTAIMALVPELNFGFTILWNGEGIGSRDVAEAVANQAIPVIVPMLQAEQEKEFPDVPAGFVAAQSTFLGKYGVTNFFDVISANVSFITSSIGQRRVQLDIPFIGTFILRPFNAGSDNPAVRRKNGAETSAAQEYVFQLNVPIEQYHSCMSDGFAAYDGEWAFFTQDQTVADGAAQMFVPGYLYEKFTKEKL